MAPLGRSGMAEPSRPAAPTGRSTLKDLHKLYRKYKKARDKYDEWRNRCEKWKHRVEQARDLLDEEKRAGTIFDLVYEWVPKLLEKGLEAAAGGKLPNPVTELPYFKYHEEHFKRLREAVVATDKVYRSDELRKKAKEIFKQLDDQAKDIQEKYKKGGKLWNDLHFDAELWNHGARTWHDEYARDLASPFAGDYLAALRRVREPIDAAVEELVTDYAVLDSMRTEIIAKLEKRAKAIEELRNGPNDFSRAAGNFAAHNDELDELDYLDRMGSLAEQAQDATNGIRRLAEEWTTEFDRRLKELDMMPVYPAPAPPPRPVRPSPSSSENAYP